MKKHFYFLFFAVFLFISRPYQSQTANFTFSPAYACSPTGSATTSSGISVAPSFSAATYQWGVGLPFGATFVYTSPNPTLANWGFNGCGVYTVYCFVYNSGVYQYNVTHTFTIFCSLTPTVGISNTAANFTLCPGGSATLTASGASTYFWPQTGATSNSIVVNPSGPGCYYVVGTHSLGCPATSSLSCISMQTLAPITISGNTVVCSGSSTTLTATGAGSYSWSTGVIGNSLIVSPITNTLYTLLRIMGGCVSHASVQVHVNPKPIVTAVASYSAVCSNANTNTLYAGGANSYTWSTGALTSSVIVTPNQSTTYTVTGKNFNNCSNTKTVMVHVDPSPILLPNVSSTLVCYPGPPVNILLSASANYSWLPANEVVPNTGPLVSVNPSVSSTYTVIGTLGPCSSSVTINITVADPSHFFLYNSSPTVCAGNAATLSASGANNYTWLPGSLSGSTVFVSPSISTNYTVIGQVGNCIFSKTDSVGVLPNPPISVNPSSMVLCSGDSAMLSAAGAMSYTWSSGSNLSTIGISPGTTTHYSVAGTLQNGCVNEKTVTVNVSNCMGINESDNENSIQIFPNPSSGIFIIRSNNGEVVSFMIQDMLGKTLFFGEFHTTEKIDLSGYGKGAYVIRLTSGNQALHKKLVIHE